MLNRSRILTKSIIREHNLRIDPPPPDSFLFRAFQKNIDIANNTLNTPFFKGIADDNLPPVVYGALTVKDSHYCYNGAVSFEIARIRAESEHALETELIGLLSSLTDSYKEYNRYFLDVWHILKPDTVVPTETSKGYVFHERRVANYEHPIYTFAAMLPCYHLWSWLGQSLIDFIDNPMYGFWIEGNASPSGSAYAIGNFIEDWQKAGKEFDEDKAMEIFSTSMEFEFAMFNEAYQPEQLKKLLEGYYHGK
ncbi:MAG: hypothetical protein LBE35_03485 [Clostridiales bacterium]|jgi:thiaminase/transcriptional activator TenA|nr:hypothetical protein [Clostridiales bacterium]